jgi:hypothetical protein
MNWKNYTIASLILIVAALLFNLACADNPCPAPKSRIVTPPVQTWQVGQGEVLYDGYIRAADWNRMTITYESSYGYIKTVGPICGNGLPVWAGMHVYELNFHWYVSPDMNPSTSNACFVVDYVLHAPTGDYKP